MYWISQSFATRGQYEHDLKFAVVLGAGTDNPYSPPLLYTFCGFLADSSVGALVYFDPTTFIIQFEPPCAVAHCQLQRTFFHSHTL